MKYKLQEPNSTSTARARAAKELVPKLVPARSRGPVFGSANCAPLLFRNIRPDPFWGPPGGSDFGSALVSKKDFLIFSLGERSCLQAEKLSKDDNINKSHSIQSTQHSSKKHVLFNNQYLYVRFQQQNHIPCPLRTAEAPH